MQSEIYLEWVYNSLGYSHFALTPSTLTSKIRAKSYNWNFFERQGAKMSNLIVLVLIFLAMNQVLGCQKNCVCLYITTCTLGDCMSPLDLEGREIHIRGTVCPNHYDELGKKWELKKFLQDSPCLSLGNCK